MISTKYLDSQIRVSCSENEVIGYDQLRRLFNTCLRFIEQHNNPPIIIELGKGMRFTSSARKVYERWDRFEKEITMVVIKS